MSILSEHYADFVEDTEPLEEVKQPKPPEEDLPVTVVEAVPFERNILTLYEIFKIIGR